MSLAGKKQFVKVCPNCGSTDIAWKIIGDTGLQVEYCQDCSYGYPDGTIFPEVEKSQIEKFRKEAKK